MYRLLQVADTLLTTIKLVILSLKAFFMKWGLIFMLSLFGLAMGIATVFWIPTSIEVFFWLAIFIYCAYVIAKKAPGKYFLHGFMVSIFNSVWITVIHYMLFSAYIAKHPDLADMNGKMIEGNDSVRTTMLAFGPVVGVISGLVLGLFSFIAARIVKDKQA